VETKRDEWIGKRTGCKHVELQILWKRRRQLCKNKMTSMRPDAAFFILNESHCISDKSFKFLSAVCIGYCIEIDEMCQNKIQFRLRSSQCRLTVMQANCLQNSRRHSSGILLCVTVTGPRCAGCKVSTCNWHAHPVYWLVDRFLCYITTELNLIHFMASNGLGRWS